MGLNAPLAMEMPASDFAILIFACLTVGWCDPAHEQRGQHDSRKHTETQAK